MKFLLKTAAFSFFILTIITAFSFTSFTNHNSRPVVSKSKNQKIQVAILLDVSGSMEGLIEQAKAQLWNMVSVMGKAQCNNNTSPQIEIALYEYGRSTNSKTEGYVKQISGFTGDLDLLSKNLFSLTTNGGDEFCGHVIYTSLKDLQWDASAENYKVIFIAGNEDFLQGDVLYTKACGEAKQKGVIVNTIYCGDSLQGVREHWNLNSECGSGSFTVINQNERIDDIPTPYDSIIFSLNEKLNGTYIAYGNAGAGMMAMQSNVDKMNYSMNKSVAVKRATVKSNGKLYKNESWDMVDANGSDEKFIEKLDKKTLPDSLKNKSTEDLKKIVKLKSEQRAAIQKQITAASAEREDYITKEKAKNATDKSQTATLETEIEKIIKNQAKRYNMVIQ